MPRYFTPYEILHLLTSAERIAFEVSTDPATILVRQDLGTITDAIDMDSAQAIAAIDVLQASGILTPSRAIAVKAGQPHGE